MSGLGFRHVSAIFALRRRRDFNKPLAMTTRSGRLSMRQEPGDDMEDTVQKSCWGVTFKALVGFAGALALAYLFGAI
ncbi:hypothetical protein [Neorhizobium sp. T6_25]|uniref:hypothetical protein n=1 Tax=Neorhizobium sp. T6_25 TaxID=2093833 RepID=UPI00155F4058|nr:hypothetical protein [Neorhizobium sp. T6_25]